MMGLVMNCTSTRPAADTEIERADEFNESNIRQEDGHPEIRLTAMGYLNEHEEGVINVTADIENRSLIYRHLDQITSAEIELAITVVGTGIERYIETFTETKTIQNDTYGALIHADVSRHEKEIIVSPGGYTVFVSVTDQASDSRTIREINVTVPDPGKELISVTPIQLFGKSNSSNNSFEPITSYNISTKTDSIRFVVQVSNNQSDTPLELRSELTRFESDTTVARPASYSNYSVSSLPYRGIDYRREENIEETRRVFDQPGIIMVEYQFVRPERGNYRFSITAEETDGEEILFRGRDFSVKGNNFPRVESARELAEPLVYLMRESEYKNLMAITDEDELKDAVDRFWLENIGSVQRARQVIELYYDRVEEANKRFSSFKEGWKTDRGMIFILFGPPARIERWINYQQWIGSSFSNDTRYYFQFRRTRMRNNHFPFDHYILQRSQSYHTYQYQQVQNWLNGHILTMN